MELFVNKKVIGAAGVARVREWLAGEPDGVAVLLAVELCSLTLQQDDGSTANLVASGLFGDGAAAVVMLGDRAARRHVLPGGAAPVQVVSSRSRMYADTAGAMGWDVGSSGLRIVLGTEVPDLVREHVRADVDTHLERHGLRWRRAPSGRGAWCRRGSRAPGSRRRAYRASPSARSRRPAPSRWSCCRRSRRSRSAARPAPAARRSGLRVRSSHQSLFSIGTHSCSGGPT